jgi:hypothetical protein
MNSSSPGATQTDSGRSGAREGNPEFDENLGDLAGLYLENGDYAPAEPLFRVGSGRGFFGRARLPASWRFRQARLGGSLASPFRSRLSDRRWTSTASSWTRGSRSDVEAWGTRPACTVRRETTPRPSHCSSVWRRSIGRLPVNTVRIMPVS